MSDTLTGTLVLKKQNTLLRVKAQCSILYCFHNVVTGANLRYNDQLWTP